MSILLQQPPLVAASACKAAVFRTPNRRAARTFIMFHGGVLSEYEAPPVETVKDGWASGSSVCGIGTLGDRRWLVLSWAVTPRPCPFNIHAAALDEHEPQLHVQWIDQNPEVRTRWDTAGCRVRFGFSRLAMTRLQDLAGPPDADGKWLYRITQPRLNVASVRIVKRAILQLFIPA